MEHYFLLKRMLMELEKGAVLSEYLHNQYGLLIHQDKDGKYGKKDWLLVDDKFMNLIHKSGCMYHLDEFKGIAKIYQDGIKIRIPCGSYDDKVGLKLHRLTQEMPEDFFKEFREDYSIKNGLIILK